MANPEHLEILKQGVEVWNRWRDENLETEPDLSGVVLTGANLSGAGLEYTQLRKADLRGANRAFAALTCANLTEANLTEANLSSAILEGAFLDGTDLQRASLSYAYLGRALIFGPNFSGADLRDATIADTYIDANLSSANLLRTYFRNISDFLSDLTGAMLGWTTFADVDLSEAEGLDAVNHRGPSTIGIDTIYRSKGLSQGSFSGALASQTLS